MYRPVFRLAAFFGAACLAASLAACGQDGPVHGAAQFVGAATTPPQPADFVKATRDPSDDYMAVGVKAPPRPTQPRSPAELKAMENSLEGTRAQLEAAGSAAKTAGETPAPVPVQTPPR
jgi:hypothetical protein